MSATDGRKRGSHARLSWRRRRATAKLVLLEYPDESGQPGKPIEMAAPPRPVGRRGNRRAIAIAAGVVAATGSIAGGSMALASGGSSATALRTPAPERVVMPDKSPMWAGIAAGPALRSAAASKAKPSPSVSPTVVQTTAAPPSPTAAAPPISVMYGVENRSFDDFEAEISVTNSGPGAVSDWNIVVVLPEDHFESWWGASGDMSDGALILQPRSSSGPLEPGQTLHVHFKASGTETTPAACAFNNISCTTS